MSSLQCIFPAEIVYGIFRHVDPRDIIRWRTVSKWFHAITSDATIWRVLYANAPFPRPPGPFPSQSTGSLERILVRSARLAESWTTRPLRDLSSEIKIPFNVPEDPNIQIFQLIRGRWLVVLEEGWRFVLHDIDAGAGMHGRRVLWETEHSREPSVCDLFWMELVERRWALYLLVGFRSGVLWKLLEFLLSDSGELCESVIINCPEDSNSLKPLLMFGASGGKSKDSPFLFIPTRDAGTVFDARTRIFFKVPPLRFALDATRAQHPNLDEHPRETQMVFSDTHSIAFHHIDAKKFVTIVQIFGLPFDDSSVKNGKHSFQLTHEGMVPKCIADPLFLKSAVDPITGTTTITLLARSLPHVPWHQIMRVDLTLSKSPAADVLPLSIAVEDMVISDVARSCWPKYLDVFDGEHARGISNMYSFYSVPTGNEPFLKFAIDTTQDPWTVTRGKFALPEWRHARKDSIADKFVGFDGIRGRVCYLDRESVGTVVVLEIE